MNKVEAYERLAKLKESGVDISRQVISLAASENDVPESVSSFIEDHEKPELCEEATRFFENLRKIGKERNHRLYYNIMDENLDEVGKLKCLSSYLTNACIAMESVEDADSLIRLRTSIGLELVSEALYEYYNGINYNRLDEALTYLRKLVK